VAVAPAVRVPVRVAQAGTCWRWCHSSVTRPTGMARYQVVTD